MEFEELIARVTRVRQEGAVTLLRDLRQQADELVAKIHLAKLGKGPTSHLERYQLALRLVENFETEQKGEN